MKLNRNSGIVDVVAAVAGALKDGGIEAVLTGGACASIYSKGRYTSHDVDFIIINDVTASQLDNAMAVVGFRRSGNQYVHSRTRFYVEFPKGPLAIGHDYLIRPSRLQIRRKTLAALSPTDSCRDRLAAFYFWSDRQSLQAAVSIARSHRLNFAKVRHWSTEEGFLGKYEEFLSELKYARTRREPNQEPVRTRLFNT
ncbi:MAG: hypothetical protein ACR2L2_18815 [Acidobacteriota bacterium]